MIQAFLSFVAISGQIAKENTDPDRFDYSTLFYYADSVLFFVCAYGIFKRSRFAAIATLFLIGIEIILEVIAPLTTSNPIIFAVVVTIYIRAFLGANTLHKIRRSEDPNYKGTRRWIVITSTILLIPIASVTVYGVLMEVGIAPSGEIELGETLDPEIREAFVQYGVLYEDEQVERYYYMGLISELAEGAPLTDRAVVYYYRIYAELFDVADFPFKQITNVQLVERKTAFADSIYMFESTDLGTLFLQLSNVNDRDQLFIDTVHMRMGAQWFGVKGLLSPLL